jgi:hypothetical protein
MTTFGIHDEFTREARMSDTQPTNTFENNKSTQLFHICPNLDCDQRRMDLRERERWKLEHNPHREFAEDILDKIINEMVTQERNDSQSIIEAVRAVPTPSRQTDTGSTTTEQSAVNSASENGSADSLSGTYLQLLRCDICDGWRVPECLPTGRYIYICDDPSCDGHQYDQHMKSNYESNHYSRSTDETSPDILREVCEICGKQKVESGTRTASYQRKKTAKPAHKDVTVDITQEVEVRIKHGRYRCSNVTCKGRQRDEALSHYLDLRYGDMKDMCDKDISDILYDYEDTSDEDVFNTIYEYLDRETRDWNHFMDSLE